MFNTKKQGYGFGAMPGFNNKKIGSLSNGDFDRDGVLNKKDCQPFNFRKQDTCAECGGSFSESEMEPEYNGKPSKYCKKCWRNAKKSSNGYEDTRRKFNEANKSGAMSKQGMMATDWM